MNKLILLALAATALANNCTIDNNPNQEYYLRFLEEKDYPTDGFTTDVLQNAKYMGYDESSEAQDYFKIGRNSKFTVKKETNGIRVFSTDSNLSTDKDKQKRIFSWNQTGASLNRGYFMYPASTSVSDKYTLLFYDDVTNELSAAQSDAAKPTRLALYENEGDTAIYSGTSNDVKKAKFCFQKVEAAKQYTCKEGPDAGCKTCVSVGSRTKDDQCASCNTHYSLNDGTCTPKFTCTEGPDAGCKTCVSVGSRTKDDQCASCNTHYSLNDGTCTPNCTEGASDDGCKTCVSVGSRTKDDQCASCNTHYSLNDGTCTPEFTCTEGASDDGCKTCVSVDLRTKDQECASCNTDYLLKSSTCTLESSFVQFGVFGALVCLFALN